MPWSALFPHRKITRATTALGGSFLAKHWTPNNELDLFLWKSPHQRRWWQHGGFLWDMIAKQGRTFFCSRGLFSLCRLFGGTACRLSCGSQVGLATSLWIELDFHFFFSSFAAPHYGAIAYPLHCCTWRWDVVLKFFHSIAFCSLRRITGVR